MSLLDRILRIGKLETGQNEMHFAGHIYKKTKMPREVKQRFNEIQKKYDEPVQAQIKHNGKVYWVRDNKCWEGTDKHIYHGPDWNKQR